MIYIPNYVNYSNECQLTRDFLQKYFCSSRRLFRHYTIIHRIQHQMYIIYYYNYQQIIKRNLARFKYTMFPRKVECKGLIPPSSTFSRLPQARFQRHEKFHRPCMCVCMCVCVPPNSDDSVDARFVISNLFLRRLIAGSGHRNSS